MKNNPEPEKGTRFILHTSAPIDNCKTNKIVFSEKNIGQVNRLVSKYGDKIKQVHLHGKIAELEYLNKDYSGMIKIFAGNKEDVIRHSRMLQERMCYICPEFPVEKLVDVSFITSMGIAVDLLYRIDHMEGAAVLQILNHYLHHTPLEIPVEPFHYILMSKLKEREVTLWHLHLLSSGRLKKYFESIPRKHPGCMSCSHFHFCFSWAKYKKETCELWQAILDIIQKNAAEIKRHMHRRQPTPPSRSRRGRQG